MRRIVIICIRKIYYLLDMFLDSNNTILLNGFINIIGD